MSILLLLALHLSSRGWTSPEVPSNLNYSLSLWSQKTNDGNTNLQILIKKYSRFNAAFKNKTVLIISGQSYKKVLE